VINETIPAVFIGPSNSFLTAVKQMSFGKDPQNPRRAIRPVINETIPAVFIGPSNSFLTAVKQMSFGSAQKSLVA